MSESGFHIDNLDNLDELLSKAHTELPDMIRRILEDLGERFINYAKDTVENTANSPATFRVVGTKGEKRGKRKKKLFRRKKKVNRVRKATEKKTGRRIEFAGYTDEPMHDTGALINSLSRGGQGGIWKFSGSAGSMSLKVGTTMKHAIYIHEGYTIKKDHWVPGIVDGNGRFRYMKGADTGIMARAREFDGIPFYEIALDELKAISPRIIQKEFEKLFKGM